MDNIAGAVTGIVILIIIIALIGLMKKKERDAVRFDERELMLRTEGYRRSFFVTIIAGALALFVVELKLIPAASATLAMFIALMAGIVTFAVYCIVKDVFSPAREKGLYDLVLCVIIILADGVTAVGRIVSGTILENGVPTFSSCSSLIMELAFLVILAALLVKRGRGEEDE